MSHPLARRFAATALLAGASALPLIGGTATAASAAGLPILGNTPAAALLGGTHVLGTPVAAGGPNSTLNTVSDVPATDNNSQLPLQTLTGALPTNQLPVGNNTLAGGPTGQLASGLAGTDTGSSPLGLLGGGA